MSEDNDDQVNRILRGNTDHDPKPEFARRQNTTPRGMPAPSPFGMTPANSVQQPRQRPATEQRNEPQGPPTVPGPPWAPGMEARKFKQTKNQTPKSEIVPEKPRPPIPEGRAARQFVRGDLTEEFRQALNRKPKL